MELSVPENLEPAIACVGVCATPTTHEYHGREPDPKDKRVDRFVFSCGKCGTTRHYSCERR